MVVIDIKNLKKYYDVHQRSSGFVSSLKSVFKREYKTVKAVNNISFRIKKGELVGFIGPNGAGKTTTLKCLSGLLYPTDGKVRVLGYEPFKRKHDYLKKISLIMGQKNQLWWNLPAIDTLRLNKEIYEIQDKFYEKTLKQLTKLLDVEDLLNTPVRQLSYGQRMKMELIAALLHKPKVLFLDEPTIGLDVVMQKNMRDFIADYNKKFKSTILLTSHYMEDVRKLCKRVIVISQGQIIYDGDVSKLTKKYTNFKVISASMNERVDRKNIEKLGKLVYFRFPNIKLKLPSNQIKSVAVKLLQEYNIKDLTIEEPEIEDVVRQLFQNQKKA